MFDMAPVEEMILRSEARSAKARWQQLFVNPDGHFQFLQSFRFNWQVRSYAFGGTNGKLFHFRGCWTGLCLLGKISKVLASENRNRAVRPLTSKSKNGKSDANF